MFSLLAIMTSFAVAPEAARLQARQADIPQDKKATRARGVITCNEHQDIRKDKRQANRVIYGQKHDNQTQPCALH